MQFLIIYRQDLIKIIFRALASFSRTAAVTGKLEVRLMGCQVK